MQFVPVRSKKDSIQILNVKAKMSKKNECECMCIQILYSESVYLLEICMCIQNLSSESAYLLSILIETECKTLNVKAMCIQF